MLLQIIFSVKMHTCSLIWFSLNSFLYHYYLHVKSFPLIEVKKKPILTEEVSLVDIQLFNVYLSQEAELHDTIHKITELEINSLLSHENGMYNNNSGQTFTYSGDDEVLWTRSRLQR